MNPDAMRKIADACAAGAASFDPNTEWWSMFWTAAGFGAFVALLAGVFALIVWASR